MRKRIYLGLQIILGLFGLGMLALAGWPSTNSSTMIRPDLTWLRNEEDANGFSLSILEQIEKTHFVVSWPQRLRPGERGAIRLSWRSESPLPSPGNWAITPARSVVAARLEVSGGGVIPAGVWHEVVDARRPMSLTWEVVPQGKAPLRGTLWVYLQASAQEGDQGTNFPILAWPFTISVVAPLGFSRWALGGLGILLLAVAVWLQKRQT